MKEKEKWLEKELNKMGASNLAEREFKVLVIRMHKQLRETTSNLMRTIRN